MEIVAAFEAALVLDALHQTGVLEALRTPATAAELARRCGVDLGVLEPVLGYAARACTLVERGTDGRFALGDDAAGLAAHMLDQYVGGYGRALAALPALLRGAGAGRTAVDLARHAAAFAADRPDGGMSEAARMVLGLGVTGVVELGCGGGQTLCALASASPDLRALGIEANPEAAAVAAGRVRTRGLSGRVRVELGEALAVLGRGVPEGVQAVLAASVLNAMWREADGAAAFVAGLGRLLPGRLLVVSDYYSHIGQADGGTARTLLHDVVQVASGQGLPPPDREGWAAAYAAAGACLLQVLEAADDGIDRFVHLVRLPG